MINAIIEKNSIEKMLKVTKQDITVTTEGEKILLIARSSKDLENATFIIIEAKGEIIETGSTLISNEILTNIPKNCYEVRVEGDKIKADKRKISFTYNNAGALVDIERGEKTNTITYNDFEKILDTEYAIAKDETRPILKNIYINNNEAVALDGYRLALRNLEGNYNESYIHEDIVKLYKKFKSADDVSIYRNGLLQTIEFDNIRLIKKIEEGKYISYKSLISENWNTSIKLESKKILEVLNSYKKIEYVRFDIEKNNLTVIASNESMSIEDEISIEKTGENLLIAANIKYLIDSFKKYENPTILFTNSVSPMYFKEDNKLDLVLPIRLDRVRKTA